MFGRTSLRTAVGAAIFLVGGAAWIGSPTPAGAVVITNADVSTALRLVDVQDSVGSVFDPLDFSADATGSTLFSNPVVGGASATAGGGVQVFSGGSGQAADPVVFIPFGINPGPGLSEGVTQNANATTFAPTSPGFHNATADATATSQIGLLNNSLFLDDLTFYFQLDYSFTGSASLDRPGFETANASIDIRIFNSLVDLIAPIHAGTVGPGIFDSFGTQTIYFSVLVPFFPTGFESFNIQVRANGSATAVPEPATLALFAIGLLAMTLLARRRRLA